MWKLDDFIEKSMVILQWKAMGLEQKDGDIMILFEIDKWSD